MNRYIKKEDYARKTIDEITGTLKQLNQYNILLMAENERLKIEDRGRMEALIRRDSVNQTR
jgi:hypothetical protein